MKKQTLFILFLLCSVGTYAQNAIDALHFGSTGMTGSAAYLGKSGAINALGRDMMSASYNPAGLALYNRSEFMFSMGPSYHSLSSSYLGTNQNAGRVNFNFGGFGILFSFPQERKDGWKSTQLSFGVNRLNSFANKAYTTGEFDYSPQQDSYIGANMNNILNSDKDLNPFIRTGVVYFDSASNDWLSDFYRSDGSFGQKQTIEEFGSLYDFNCSFSRQQNDVFYYGISVSFPFGNYASTSSFSEDVQDAANNPLGEYKHIQHQEISVFGFNVKSGIIIRPIDALRLGFAIHTPTLYSVEDNYDYNVSYDGYKASLEEPTFEYHLITPFKFLTGIAGVFGSQTSVFAGTVSLDYEYQDFRFSRFSLSGLDAKYESEINNEMQKDIFSSKHDIRIGGELKYGLMSFRGGLGFFANPYKPGYNKLSSKSFSLGFGYRDQYWFFDLAYVQVRQQMQHYMYNRTYTAPANMKKQDHLFQASIGFTF